MLCSFSLCSPWNTILSRAPKPSLPFHPLADAGHIKHNISVGVSQASRFDHSFTGVIAGCYEPQLAVEFLHQPRKIANSTRNVLFEVATIADSKPDSRLRHKLHDPGCSFRRYGADLPTRFLLNYSAGKIKWDAIVICVSRKIILRYLSAVRLGLAVATRRQQKQH